MWEEKAYLVYNYVLGHTAMKPAIDRIHLRVISNIIRLSVGSKYTFVVRLNDKGICQNQADAENNIQREMHFD